MVTTIYVKGKTVSWIVELVIGVVSGVASGIILARLVPDGSMAPEPTASGGGAVTQQVMAANVMSLWLPAIGTIRILVTITRHM